MTSANQWASATLKHPDGTQVHLIGVSHISAFSGHHVYHAIRNIRPDAVVLEVDERRYKEAAVRAQRWLVNDDKRALVAHATQSYLQPGGIWRQLLWKDKRSVYNLSNEGGALVEGSIYGSEVILACEAASQCSAEIVLADRSKPVSNARLAKALLDDRQKSLQEQADDDASLLMRAAALTVQQFKDHISNAVQALTATSSEFYGERLHPIFLLVAKPHYKLALKGAGCSDPDAVIAALERLMTHGSAASGDIAREDLQLVQESIARIERQKARMRQRAFATTNTPPATITATTPQAAVAADACSSVDSASVPAPHPEVPSRGDHTAEASCSGASNWSGSSLLRAVRSFFMDEDAHPAADCTDAFYQWCWRGVGNMHSFKLHEHVADFDSTHLYTGPADMSPYYRTVVHERDTILATRLWHEAANPSKKTIVAVVGANHLPGIIQNWAAAGSDEMRSQCSEFLAPPTTKRADAFDVAASHSWQDAVVHGTAAAMQGVVVGALAYAPTKLVFARARGVRVGGWPLQLAAVPAVVLGGLTVGASLSESWRMTRLAQLVDNLAAVPNIVE